MNPGSPFWVIPAADGSEDLELVGTVDLLRRADMNIIVAGVNGPEPLLCSRGTRIVPDAALGDVPDDDRCAGIILPGGMPGTRVLEESIPLRTRLQRLASGPAWIAAICAAPRVLAAAGLLNGRRYTAYPGAVENWKSEQADMQHRVMSADVDPIDNPTGNPIEVDGKLITGRGPGVVFEFALAILEHARPQERERVETALQRA